MFPDGVAGHLTQARSSRHWFVYGGDIYARPITQEKQKALGDDRAKRLQQLTRWSVCACISQNTTACFPPERRQTPLSGLVGVRAVGIAFQGGDYLKPGTY